MTMEEAVSMASLIEELETPGSRGHVRVEELALQSAELTMHLEDEREAWSCLRVTRETVAEVVPHWREGLSADALPDVYWDIVEVVADAPAPMQAKQIVPGIGLPAVTTKIEGTRGRLFFLPSKVPAKMKRRKKSAVEPYDAFDAIDPFVATTRAFDCLKSDLAGPQTAGLPRRDLEDLIEIGRRAGGAGQGAGRDEPVGGRLPVLRRPAGTPRPRPAASPSGSRRRTSAPVPRNRP
ncbi:hypothetical protein ACIRU3_42595 [Streptomyces sp. NPDC101151]|uniref:hypothetical protein n=1 Tax=Streptomyces sp. NPDC101151 TaxID=3366115 RepID=UPI00380BCB01